MFRKDWLEGMTSAEVAALQRVGIITPDDLWRKLGKNRRLRVGRLAAVTGIPEGRLAALIAAQALRRQPLVQASWWQRNGVSWLLVVALPLLALLGLFIRVALPGWLGAAPRGMIAARPLKAGQVLVAADLYPSLLPMARDYFSEAQSLEGLVMAKDVAASQPLRYTDVLRPQLVAARQIDAGAILTSQAISVTWSTYQPDAALSPEQALGYRARYPFQKGEVLLNAFLEPVGAVSSQVVVQAAQGLPAYHVIAPGEVILKQALAAPGSFSDLDEVVGGYLLEALPAGAPVRREALVPQPAFAGRTLATIPLSAGISPAIRPGQSVDLAVYPAAQQGETPAPPQALSGVIVIAVNATGDPPELTAALTPEQAAALLAQLGKSRIFVVQRSP